jgi:hypothetical protein
LIHIGQNRIVIGGINTLPLKLPSLVPGRIPVPPFSKWELSPSKLWGLCQARSIPRRGTGQISLPHDLSTAETNVLRLGNRLRLGLAGPKRRRAECRVPAMSMRGVRPKLPGSGARKPRSQSSFLIHAENLKFTASLLPSPKFSARPPVLPGWCRSTLRHLVSVIGCPAADIAAVPLWKKAFDG